MSHERQSEAYFSIIEMQVYKILWCKGQNLQAEIVPSANEIFGEELLDDLGDVSSVDFVNQAMDTLLQQIPRQSLIGFTKIHYSVNILKT